MRKLFVVLLLTLVSLFAVAAPAMAMDRRQASRVEIGKDEVIYDEMMLTGTTISVDGIINGDLFAFGTSIVINGTINGNLIAAGDRVEIKGTVTGSVYGAARNVYVSGRIDRTLTAGGTSVTLEPTAHVGNSGLLAGNLVRVNGTIGRGALLGGTRVEVGGRIGKELTAYVDNLTIGARAAVEGAVDYTSDRTATIDQGARTGAVTFHRFLAPHATAAGNLWWRVLRAIGFMLAGLAALALFPGLRGRYPEILVRRPWQAPLAGLVALVAVPVGALILLITVVGIPLSLLTLGLLPALIYLSQVLVSWTVGKLLAERVEGLRTLRWPVIFLLGALLTSVATALPGVGFVVGFIALLYGLGGLYYLTVQRAG